MMNEYAVALGWDDEARKWYALNDDIPIALEDASLDNLISRVKLAVPEMLELNGKASSGVRLFFRMETRAVLA
jgi:hypothetical protein